MSPRRRFSPASAMRIPTMSHNLHLLLLVVLSTSLIIHTDARTRTSSNRRHEKTEVNLCSKDIDMKLACHCSHDDAKRTVVEADCFVLHEDFPQSDAAWLSFRQHPNLRHFTLTVHRNGYMSYLPSDVLNFQRELRSVTITYADIREIPMYAFGNLTRLENITLIRSQVEVLAAYAFANHASLVTLNLEDNQIVQINKLAFSNLPELLELTLTKNNITKLHEDMFEDLGKLSRLRMNENQIGDLTKDVFKGLGNLKVLDLSINGLRFLRDTVFSELWSMQELDLESNLIERLSERAFDGLNNLRSLNLRNNKLQSLEGGVFTGVPALITLDLNANALESLTYNNVLPLMDNLVNNTNSLLAISDNKFTCDCRLAWMYDLRARTKNSNIRRTLDQTSCAMIRAAAVSHNPHDPSRYNLPYKPQPKTYSIMEYDEYGNELNEKNHQQQMLLHHNEPANQLVNIDTYTCLVMNIGVENLPCPLVQEIDPTELPLPRESIGIDLSWLSTSTNHSPGVVRSIVLLALGAVMSMSRLFS